jgi:hypothetical protein
VAIAAERETGASGGVVIRASAEYALSQGGGVKKGRSGRRSGPRRKARCERETRGRESKSSP